MTNKNLQSEQADRDLNLLAQRVEANRADLIRRCELVVRKSVFSNRIEMRPSDIGQIAIQEADALICALRDSFTSARQHGVELSQAGLNSQTVFEFIQVEQEFLITTLEDNGSALKFTSPYPLKMVAGFMEEREKVIRREQENIRSAFQIALEHANTATRAAQVIAQEATELSYRKIIIAQEEERRRISRELHDDAGQTMVGLRMNLENIKTSLSSNPELEKEMEKALFWTDNAIRKIRSLAYRLRPPMLDLLGINLAIKQLCFDFSEQTDLVIHYNGIETPALNDELSISIYRIVQEALTNIIKHASANQAWIRLKYARELIELTIKDNGLGFDLETTRTGIGLNGMQERCQLLSGNMQIKSAKGKPTLLKFSFPVLAAHDQTT